MKLIFIYGLPGVGKMTVAKALSERTGIRMIDNHVILDIVREYIPRTTPESVELARDIRIRLFIGAAKYNTGDIITTMAGGNVGVVNFVKQLTKGVEQHGGEVVFIHLVCERDEHLKRVHDPKRSQNKIVTEDELEEFLKKDYFKGHPDKKSILIDNTTMNPDECAQKIIELATL